LLDNDGFQAALVREGSIVGMVGFTGVDWKRRSTGIGYWLAAEQQGRGIVTAAVRRLVEHAFAVWRLERVEVGERRDLVVYAIRAHDWLSGARGAAGPSAPR
jgi:RimJ/RimL family protein N-acetyltransferase